MKQYKREEIISELAWNVCVSWKGYGTWEIKSHIGQRETACYCEHTIEVSEITNNEEDQIGIMDGKKYNPQDYNEWLNDSAQYEIEDYGQLNEDELKDLFDEYCKTIWADSANDDNYEPREERDTRLAERLFDALIEDDRVIECSNGNIVVLEQRESEFLCNNYGGQPLRVC